MMTFKICGLKWVSGTLLCHLSLMFHANWILIFVKVPFPSSCPAKLFHEEQLSIITTLKCILTEHTKAWIKTKVQNDITFFFTTFPPLRYIIVQIMSPIYWSSDRWQYLQSPKINPLPHILSKWTLVRNYPCTIYLKWPNWISTP